MKCSGIALADETRPEVGDKMTVRLMISIHGDEVSTTVDCSLGGIARRSLRDPHIRDRAATWKTLGCTETTKSSASSPTKETLCAAKLPQPRHRCHSWKRKATRFVCLTNSNSYWIHPPSQPSRPIQVPSPSRRKPRSPVPRPRPPSTRTFFSWHWRHQQVSKPPSKVHRLALSVQHCSPTDFCPRFPNIPLTNLAAFARHTLRLERSSAPAKRRIPSRRMCTNACQSALKAPPIASDQHQVSAVSELDLNGTTRTTAHVFAIGLGRERRRPSLYLDRLFYYLSILALLIPLRRPLSLPNRIVVYRVRHDYPGESFSDEDLSSHASTNVSSFSEASTSVMLSVAVYSAERAGCPLHDARTLTLMTS